VVDRPHVALVTNTGWSMVRYRGELISALLERGWQVSAIADFSDQDLAHLRRLRVAPVRLELAAASQNPFKDLGYFSRLVRTLRSLQPDLVHNFSVKPVIYGSLAAKLVGIEAIVNSITGGGMLRAGERGGLQRVLRLLSPGAAWRAGRHLPESRRPRFVRGRRADRAGAHRLRRRVRGRYRGARA
jgi:hypothetical protein